MTKQLRIDIDSELHKGFRTAALSRGVTMRKLLTGIIQSWVTNHEKVERVHRMELERRQLSRDSS